MGKEDKEDLTALEDIGHYLHQLNPEIDKKLEFGKKETEIHEQPLTPEENIPAAASEEFALESPTKMDEFKTEEPSEEVKAEELITQEASVEESNIVDPTPTQEAATAEETPLVEPTSEEVTPPEVAPVEKFEEIKEFGKNISATPIATPGNPPYSVVIRNIKYTQDGDDILASLKEYGIANTTNENIYKQSLSTGSILISQIAESTAILLAHKFRFYDMEIEMGLSEEVRPPKTREKVGLVNKTNLHQNKTEYIDLNFTIDPKEILISTTPTLENFVINRYIGIISEHSIIAEAEVTTCPWEERYSFLSNCLKNQAIKLRGNAVVGVSFQLTPISPSHMKIVCTGNVVWVSPRNHSS